MAAFLIKQILKHGAKKGPKKVKDFLKFVKDGKYKDKTGKITDTNKKVKNSELDLETMAPPSQKKNGLRWSSFKRLWKSLYER